MYVFFFIPKHRIDRHSSRSDIEVAKQPMLDICVTSQPCNKRACNNRINKHAINDLYGTIASHDEVWQFNRGI